MCMCVVRSTSNNNGMCFYGCCCLLPPSSFDSTMQLLYFACQPFIYTCNFIHILWLFPPQHSYNCIISTVHVVDILMLFPEFHYSCSIGKHNIILKNVVHSSFQCWSARKMYCLNIFLPSVHVHGMATRTGPDFVQKWIVFHGSYRIMNIHTIQCHSEEWISMWDPEFLTKFLILCLLREYFHRQHVIFPSFSWAPPSFFRARFDYQCDVMVCKEVITNESISVKFICRISIAWIMDVCIKLIDVGLRKSNADGWWYYTTLTHFTVLFSVLCSCERANVGMIEMHICIYVLLCAAIIYH